MLFHSFRNDPFYFEHGWERSEQLHQCRRKLFRQTGRICSVHKLYSLSCRGILMASTAIEFSSGRSHNRQINAVRDLILEQGTTTVIMEPGGSFRYSPTQSIDLSIGKRINLGNDVQIRVDGQIFNLLNSGSGDIFLNPLPCRLLKITFIPDTWVKPRRLQVRIGFQF